LTPIWNTPILDEVTLFIGRVRSESYNRSLFQLDFRQT
jgi:hypothetical protein